MKNIHVLPTDKSSRLYLNTGEWFFENDYSLSVDECINQHIYITSYSEEIKEGDWIITKGKLVKLSCMSYDMVKGSKVIITTDQDLIKDGIQAIDDEFLEWFVKNPSREEVKVIYGLFNTMGRQVDPMNLGQNHSQCAWKYKIIIPKKESKQEYKYKEFQQNLVNKLRSGELTYENASIYTVILDLVQGNGKEEVLRVFNEVIMEEHKQELPIVNGSYGCIIQTKKQEPKQEKMYSEEEVIAIVEKSRETGLNAEYLLLTEQFKKK